MKFKQIMVDFYFKILYNILYLDKLVSTQESRASHFTELN